MQNYHSAHDAFPPSRGGPKFSGHAPGATELNNVNGERNCQWGPSMFALPFMEQTSRYDLLMSVLTIDKRLPPPWNNTSQANAIPKFYSELWSAMLCPSDSYARDPSYCEGEWLADDFSRPHAKRSYATCYGDYINNNHNLSANQRGMLVPIHFNNISLCIDGTSNTLLFSERCTITALNARLTKGSGVYGVSGIDTNPSNCYGALVSGNPKEYDASATLAFNEIGGLTFDGRIYGSGFTTILPPNSPTCASGNNYGYAVASVSSYHSGGVNATFVDGSVQFISETIDCGRTSWSPGGTSASPNATTAPYRESNYGVWGAMGTRNGGESKRI